MYTSEEFIKLRDEKVLEIGRNLVVNSAVENNPVKVMRSMEPMLDAYREWVKENMPKELLEED